MYVESAIKTIFASPASPPLHLGHNICNHSSNRIQYDSGYVCYFCLDDSKIIGGGIDTGLDFPTVDYGFGDGAVVVGSYVQDFACCCCGT